MKRWVITLIVLNILDCIFTVLMVGYDVGYEYNPFVRYILEVHPALFVSAKVAVAFLAATLINEEDPKYRKAVMVLTFIYAAIVGTQIGLIIRWITHEFN